MITTDERLKVLKMVAEGKITAEEAAELLEALEESSGEIRAGSRAYDTSGRWFRVRVTDTQTSKPRINLRMPLGLVTAGLKMGMKFAPEIEGISPQELLEAIQSGKTGRLVELDNLKDNEHVEVFVD